ncbi:DNA topoisomerase IB [Maribacter sp. 2307ULW6-5]|uniref:DNA topoisomerase IB n=1 Tax=Maribacter sp. 2307ULW6-5 TaxID=3386275 RepID=UPI0039BC4776
MTNNHMAPTVQEVDDSAMGITRQKYGKGYAYYAEDGTKITDKATLKRLRKLVVPPMWSDVLICKFPDGHIQAVGRDAKGRKQYIYHPVYEKQRQQQKFKKLLAFVGFLPQLRQRAHAHLNRSGWPKRKVLALILLLLDEYGVRIGNREYRRRNGSYGLTTLRRKHLDVLDHELRFTFTGKSHKPQEVHIDNEELVPFIKKAADLPGYEIFRYRNEKGQWESVDSEEVNAYILEVTGAGFSSKYFRTWAANKLAVEVYPLALEDQRNGSRKKFSNIVLKMVASELGNTPTVCKEYYVHPHLFRAIDGQSVSQPNPFQDAAEPFGLDANERLAQEHIREGYGQAQWAV